jgi:hypothetical protein
MYHIVFLLTHISLKDMAKTIATAWHWRTSKWHEKREGGISGQAEW